MEICCYFHFCRATFVDCVTEVVAKCLSFDFGSVTVANNQLRWHHQKTNLRCFFFFHFRYFAHLSKSSLNNKRVVSPLLFRVLLRARATKHKISSSSFALHHLLLISLTNKIQFLRFSFYSLILLRLKMRPKPEEKYKEKKDLGWP